MPLHPRCSHQAMEPVLFLILKQWTEDRRDGTMTFQEQVYTDLWLKK